MSEVAHTIDLDLARKLREDEDYRHAFFHAEASAEIARQLIELRKRRALTQSQVADLTGTGQPAISRYEQADYQNWTVTGLRGITDALNGRLRVVIEAFEDVLGEYETPVALDDGTERIGGNSLGSALKAAQESFDQRDRGGRAFGFTSDSGEAAKAASR